MKAKPVHGCFGKRAATPKPDPRMHVGVAAAKTRSAVAVGDADRAERSEVVQVKNRPRASCPSRSQRPPAEERVKVVRVHHLRVHAPNGGGHLIWIEPAGQHAVGRGGTPSRLARSLE
jgi:hypothetical protein